MLSTLVPLFLVKIGAYFDVFVSELDGGSDGTWKLSGHWHLAETISRFLICFPWLQAGWLGGALWWRLRQTALQVPGAGDLVVSPCPGSQAPRPLPSCCGGGWDKAKVQINLPATGVLNMRQELSPQFRAWGPNGDLIHLRQQR